MLNSAEQQEPYWLLLHIRVHLMQFTTLSIDDQHPSRPLAPLVEQW